MRPREFGPLTPSEEVSCLYCGSNAVREVDCLYEEHGGDCYGLSCGNCAETEHVPGV